MLEPGSDLHQGQVEGQERRRRGGVCFIDLCFFFFFWGGGGEGRGRGGL